MAPGRRLTSEQYTTLVMCPRFPEGQCARSDCSRSHSLIDTTRFSRLVGDISLPSVARRVRGKPLAVAEYPKGCMEKGLARWEIILSDGGRTSLDGEGWSISVQPTYPMTSRAAHLSEALSELEVQIFGKHSPVAWPERDPRGTCCIQFSKGACRRDPCKYSHDLLDTAKVEGLVSSARSEMRCNCILPSIQFICLTSADGPLKWRIIFGEPGQSSSSVESEPKAGTVVVDGTKLVTAFSALEQKFKVAKYHANCTRGKTAMPSRPPPVPRAVPKPPASATPLNAEAPPSYHSVFKNPAQTPTIPPPDSLSGHAGFPDSARVSTPSGTSWSSLLGRLGWWCTAFLVGAFVSYLGTSTVFPTFKAKQESPSWWHSALRLLTFKAKQESPSWWHSALRLLTFKAKQESPSGWYRWGKMW